MTYEELDLEKVKDVDFWQVSDEYVNLSATSIKEAIEDWKEKVDEEPEAYFESVKKWEEIKQNPEAKITVTAFKRIQQPAPKAESILDDIITTIEENDSCPEENNYRSNKKLLEAAESFKKVIEKEIDPWYYPAFEVLCPLNCKE